MNNEALLDELFTLQAKRAAEIIDKGELFEIEGSAATVRATPPNGANIMYALPDSPLRPNLVVRKSGGGSYYILSATLEAGRQVLKVMPITVRYDLYSKATNGTDASGKPIVTINLSSSNRPARLSQGGALEVPLLGCPDIGAVIKTSSSLYEVTGRSSNQQTVILRLAPFIDPRVPKVKAVESDMYGFSKMQYRPTFKI
ncbi:hypothetical protein OR1_01768 [Geobacter sp. OR-1]|uniref:hypothetical protein n=1 Tax=Geobacter sp. OR-1 TaxID=1266765 RepID=UPI0005428B62|nr:hypothetical protein [Geobacter sp. OR-1]GAM09489.1 hypothetical protein OR1_01768 [Geobacter sp. OR-1]